MCLADSTSFAAHPVGFAGFAGFAAHPVRFADSASFAAHPVRFVAHPVGSADSVSFAAHPVGSAGFADTVGTVGFVNRTYTAKVAGSALLALLCASNIS